MKAFTSQPNFALAVLPPSDWTPNYSLPVFQASLGNTTLTPEARLKTVGYTEKCQWPLTIRIPEYIPKTRPKIQESYRL